jgi:acyl carrier protein
MPDALETRRAQALKAESIAAGCARIFRDVACLDNSSEHYGWSDYQVLQEPLEELEIDSLTLLEFVMAVEEAYAVELDEDDVNLCKNVNDLVQLVTAARNDSQARL